MKTDFSSPFNPNQKTSMPDGNEGSLSIRLKKMMPWIAGIVLPAIMAFLLYFFESDTLYRIQELNLFLPTKVFWQSLTEYPGGALLWISCFLTQFFYYPAAGCCILALLWILLFFAIKNTYRLSNIWSILSAAAPACLLASITQMGYFIYYIKLQGYFFAGTCGFLIAIYAVWLFSRIRRPYNLAWIVAWTVIGYPLLGTYALLGTVYMGLLAIFQQGSWLKDRIVPLIISLLLVAGIPLIAYQFYSQTSLSTIYTAALPSFDVAGQTYTEYRLPFEILFFSPVVFTLLHRINLQPKTWTYAIIQVAALGILIYLIKPFWYHDENFKKELRMNRAIEEENWEAVIRESLEGDAEPTRQIVMYRNLALFRLGRAGNEMFHYREGGAKPNAPFPVRLVQVGGKTLYYNYGQLNYCYRWCMEDGVVFGWKAEYYKFMARTSLLNGEMKAAEKYLNLLSQTLFHKKWAERYKTYLEHPENIKKDPALKAILSLKPQRDELASDLNVIEMYLLKHFAYDDSDDPVYQEQTLIAALQMKDIDLFWRRFMKYATLHPKEEMPIHYQEAAYLYGHLENKVDISHMPFSQGVIDSYNRFMEFTQQCAGLTEEQMATAFYPQFGQTFYYYYFLIRGLQTY